MDAGPSPARRSVSRPLLLAAGVAFSGALETAWLTIAWLEHGHLPCAAGARLDCEALFLASGTLPLGLPLPAWGHAAYALSTLLALGAVWLEGVWAARSRATFHALAVGMALFSVFLVVRMLGLGALCPWCLLSAALSLSLGTLALADAVRRPAGEAQASQRPAAPRALLGGVALAGLMVALTLVAGARRPAEPAGDPRRLAALAHHLSAGGARFYGVWWCEGCREQKELFGAAALDLPYVDCSRGAPPGITEYPTWQIGRRRVTGVMTPDSLAALSGFRFESGGQPR